MRRTRRTKSKIQHDPKKPCYLFHFRSFICYTPSSPKVVYSRWSDTRQNSCTQGPNVTLDLLPRTYRRSKGPTYLWRFPCLQKVSDTHFTSEFINFYLYIFSSFFSFPFLWDDWNQGFTRFLFKNIIIKDVGFFVLKNKSDEGLTHKDIQ